MAKHMNRNKLFAVAVIGVWLAGCGGVEDVGENVEPTGIVYEDGDAHTSSTQEVGKVHATACLSSYDTRIQDARNWITANCGSISACGSGDTSTHADLKLSNAAYCTCYSKMWNVRNSYPFDGLQVIYHEVSACSWNHIHLQVKNTCGILHFDLDEGTDNDCYDNESTSMMDEFFCSAGSRKGTCN